MTALIHDAKEALRELSISPRKRYGQNFMVDAGALASVVNAAHVGPDRPVLEIGPGLGFLTAELVKRARRVIAVEMDRALAARLERRYGGPHLSVLRQDVLDLELSGIAGAGPKIKVVGNIPYNITSPILEWLIDQKAFVSDATLTVQREVAERLTAKPGTKAWGALSAFVQFHCVVSVAAKIGRSCFWPSPKVDSAVVTFEFPDRPTVRVTDQALYFRLVRRAFQKRRKTLLNALTDEADPKLLKPRVQALLDRARIDAKRRPETVTPAEWAVLTEMLGESISR